MKWFFDAISQYWHVWSANAVNGDSSICGHWLHSQCEPTGGDSNAPKCPTCDADPRSTGLPFP